VPIWDYGFDEKHSIFYIVTKFIEGPSLAQVLHKRGRLAFKESVQIAFQVADALDYAHANGIYHLDLKPGNISIEAEKSSDLYHKSAYVADFGLSL
jgi:serine/threonine-protein kinase